MLLLFIVVLVRRFAGDRRGDLTVIFAITLIPLLALIGAAIDYSRASKARTAMQMALDATALAISSNAASQTSRNCKPMRSPTSTRCTNRRARTA